MLALALPAALGCAVAAPRQAAIPASGHDAVVVAQLFRPCGRCVTAPVLGALRASAFAPLPHAHVVATVLPDHDRVGRTFDAEPWETEALRLQGHLFGGATSWPSRGSYRESDADGRIGQERLILEQTRMVVSFASESDFSATALRALADFLTRFKNATGQDSVALMIDGQLYLR